MNLYSLSLAIGAVGFLAMALTGLGRHGAPGHGSGSGHGPIHGHGPSHGHGHVGAKHSHHIHGSSARATAVSWLWSLTSPRVLFSLLIGFGTTGLAVRGVLGAPFALGAAIAGGLLFEQLFVGPVWNFLMRFASAPALTLESCLQDEVRASTAFDADGHGLVTAEVDGQVVQVLATLRPEDRAAGVRIRAGDALRIEDVDSRRNRCTVSYIGPRSGATLL
ncbi:MAG TPA: hypothetical protein VG454_09080 [Gemmatimonadales bacterium]|nr:hypothetical protein [Gemmatimonadales bacterium]